MIFQNLDTKKECAGVYVQGSFLSGQIPAGLTATWKYSSHLDLPVLYANLYCAGKPMHEVCPLSKKEEWLALNGHLRHHLSACQTAKVDLEQNCFYDLIPEKFLLDYCELRNQITQHVIENYPKPENYDFLLSVVKMLAAIKERDLEIDFSPLQKMISRPRARSLYKKLAVKNRHRIDYDPFKSKTGRLTTTKSSFPILTLDRTFRSIIKPKNNYFVELDFNAAELRTLLALSGREQPQEDLHEWNVKNVYRGQVTRDDAKRRIFAWLYNPSSKDRLASRAYNREAVVQKYFEENQVKTFFDRVIPADDHHALNYIIQSTTSDLFLKRAVEVGKILQDKKSDIAFLLHDSMVIDFAKEDTNLLNDIIAVFSDTDFGRYLTNVSVGKDYGNMKRYIR